MHTTEELTARIAALRIEQDNLYDRNVYDLADIVITYARLATIRTEAHLIAAYLRILGASDAAEQAERGWAYVDTTDEDDYSRWCEEQRAKEACRLFGYQCGLCRDCRRNGLTV